jgi:murein DD-endopeptidase MepM/ murein hydrolase activator NlpD
MIVRSPSQVPLANSPSRFALLIRTGSGFRAVELGRGMTLAILALGIVLALWFSLAATILIARDEMVGAFLGGERRSVQAYEDRIAELRARIDRISAHQVMNQDTIEDRVAGLVARQAEIEARHVIVTDLESRAGRAGLPAEVSNRAPAPLGAPLPGHTLSFAPAPPRKPQPLEPLAPLQSGATAPSPAARGPLESVIGEIERRSGQMEHSQIERLKEIGDQAALEIERGRKMVAALGLDPARFGRMGPAPAPIRRPAPLDEMTLRDVNPDASAIGGPLLPARPAPAIIERFESEASRTESALEGALKARMAIGALPIGRPLGERYDLTSGFGTRLDPFTRSLALHSGIDFRAPTGTAVRAVAAGKIIEAGYNGGYGRMVEIDHGFGITTRYAHLSAISVSEGESVARGAVIGQVGSTGRSTGPHLHYEVRIDDDAADPMRFVRAERLPAD